MTKTMKILVSTTKTQGHRPSDFCFVPDGERLYRGVVCATDRNDPSPDGGCGCGRSLVGVLCHKATTTFEVVDAPEMDEHRLISMCEGAMQDSQMAQLLGGGVYAYARQTALEMRDAAARYPAGTVLELRSGQFNARAQ